MTKDCTNDDIVHLLIESEALSEHDEVLFDVALKQLGIDSLDKFNLFLLIEERYEVKVPDEDFERLDTITGIAGYVAEKLR